ncbi:Glycerol-3-phosphate dehydrogenase [NAD(+)] [Durusdinium trenchii]|uniref:Cytoplasmic (GPD-C) (GPDH-C) n=1 Tax=Durusdinium trenchii TaxID=1381693 RepID=A0ABP0MRZ1_9DINO
MSCVFCVRYKAAILVFVLPHQFLPALLNTIKNEVLPDAVAVSLVKGYLEIDRQDGTLRTGAQLISSELNITCAVLNGANVASDVAEEHFAEATLGCSNETQSLTLWNLLNSENFSVRTTKDVLGVELCGGFKNVVALAAGFSVP